MNTGIITKLAYKFSVLLVAFTLVLSPIAPTFAQEVPPQEPTPEGFQAQSFFGGGGHEDKVEICHVNEGNGYTHNSVNESSITDQNGHDTHNDGGPYNIGDIIPPFWYGPFWNLQQYPGQNWVEPYISLHRNDCVPEGEIKVIKVVTGTTTVKAKDFKLFVGQTSVDNNKWEDFDAGTYTVSEQPKLGVPTGFTTTFSGDCDANGSVTVGLGEKKTCTITNDYTPRPTTGTIIVKKQFGKDTEPVAEEMFSFTVNGEGSVAFEADGQNDLTLMQPGAYSIVETAAQGYTTTYQNCEFTLDAGETETCVITNTEVEEVATIIAHKIVCTDETDLPNGGTVSGPTMTANTASDWVNDPANPSCELEAGWSFEWAQQGTPNPGDQLYGAAGGAWTTFGPTDANGVTSVTLTADQIGQNKKDVWVREVLQDGYIPFTYEPNDTNTNNVTAEIYCSVDGLNYDNYDRIDDIEVGNTYHCVAWNVPVEVPTEEIKICKYDSKENLLPGWGMTLTNGETTYDLVTGENGCVTQEVNPNEGPWEVTEVDQQGWELVDVWSSEYGDLIYDGEQKEIGCEFFAPVDYLSIQTVIDQTPVYQCSFMNRQTSVPVCEIGENLLENGSFEDPEVTNGAGWDIFASGTSGLDWVVDWVSAFVGAPATANIELHGGVNDWDPADGAQYAELDSDWQGPAGGGSEQASTRISQVVTTEPGAEYELSFMYAARPGTGLSENQLGVYVDDIQQGVALAADGGGNAGADPVWNVHSYSFLAGEETTEIALADLGTANSVGTFVDDVVLCLVKEAPQCVPEPNGGYADFVVEEDTEQGQRKGGSDVLAERSNPESALGTPDSSFFSLGFGGVVVVGFDSYVPDVDGNDISIHETTNGVYPEETALIEVSQDGIEWKEIGTANNQTDVAGVSYFDIASTGWTWVKYVRVTDTTNPQPHNNDADGFDLAAVDATQTVCDQPEDPEVPENQCSIEIVSDTTNTVVVEGDDTNAVLVSFIHENWDAIIAGASWIWSEDPIADPINDTFSTFEKTFVWDGPVSSTTLDIAADNSYEVYLNGDLIGSSTDEDNFGSSDNYTGFNASVEQGTNTLQVVVKNWEQEGGTPKTNPAGLLYKLTVAGTDDTCGSVPDDGGGDGDSSSTSGGGGGGKKISLTNTNTDDEPEGEVLGDSTAQTAILPAGAPNTGMGGTATAVSVIPGFAALIALIGSALAIRRNK